MIFQLNQNKWDKAKLLESYYSENSSDKNSQSKPDKGKNLKKSGDLVNCDICYTESDVMSTTSLDCDHAYCNACWSEYLTTKIMDEGASQTITCPTNGCNTLVDDQIVYMLITESEVKLIYQVTRMVINYFLKTYVILYFWFLNMKRTWRIFYGFFKVCKQFTTQLFLLTDTK